MRVNVTFYAAVHIGHDVIVIVEQLLHAHILLDSYLAIKKLNKSAVER